MKTQENTAVFFLRGREHHYVDSEGGGKILYYAKWSKSPRKILSFTFMIQNLEFLLLLILYYSRFFCQIQATILAGGERNFMGQFPQSGT